ncbi:MAG: hypothetical protein JWR89_1076 [Tardiphaga sp.]|nr:hypothetical protein [Tardiphaga sp.]
MQASATPIGVAGNPGMFSVQHVEIPGSLAAALLPPWNDSALNA